MLLHLALSRSQANPLTNREIKELIRGALEAAKQEIAHLEDLIGTNDSSSGNGRKDACQAREELFFSGLRSLR